MSHCVLPHRNNAIPCDSNPRFQDSWYLDGWVRQNSSLPDEFPGPKGSYRVMSADGGPPQDPPGRGRLSFLGRRLSPAFELRSLTLAPGSERRFDEAEWRDCLVVVEEGEIDLECTRGGRRRFRSGDVLCLTGLPLRALINRGTLPAMLVAISRRSRKEPPEP